MCVLITCMLAGWILPLVFYVLPYAFLSLLSTLFLPSFSILTPRFFSFSSYKNRQYYYYYLTVEGIDYLRQYLNLPQDVVPQTHSKKEGRPARPAGFADRGDRPEGERERRPFDKEKRLGPDGSFAPSFGGGGFGRGGGGNREGGYRG